MPDSPRVSDNGEPIEIDSTATPSGVYDNGVPVVVAGGSGTVFANGVGIGEGHTIYMVCDNFQAVYFDGNLIHDRTDGVSDDWTEPASTPVAVGAGEHVVAVHGYNSDGTDGPYSGFAHDVTPAALAWSIQDSDENLIAEVDEYDSIDDSRVYSPTAGRDSPADGPPTDGDGRGWHDPDYDDTITGWEGPQPVSSTTIKDDVGNIDDSHFPPPSDPHRLWDENGAPRATEHVDEVFVRTYFSI